MSNIYDILSGVPARTGGEFKLLYGNREKIGKASGLAVWAFDDIATKAENLIFTETLEPDRPTGYDQYIEPMTGGEYKLLYGNREKIKLASSKGEFVFGEIADRPQIPGADISQSEPASCDYLTGSSGCETISTYTFEADNAQDKFIFEWSVDSANAEIISDPKMNFVRVQTNESTIDQTFNLTCTVIDSMVAQSIVTKSFTHTRVGYPVIVINNILEDTAGSCEYDIGGTCVATSIHTVDVNSADVYAWTISGNATIISGAETATVTVQSTNNSNVSFTLECTCSNLLSIDSMSKVFTHARTENPGEEFSSTVVYDNTNIATEFIA